MRLREGTIPARYLSSRLHVSDISPTLKPSQDTDHTRRSR